jgi:hypothetical protein
MKPLKIKATVQIGSTKVDISGELCRIGLTQQMQVEYLTKLVARAIRMMESQ